MLIDKGVVTFSFPFPSGSLPPCLLPLSVMALCSQLLSRQNENPNHGWPQRHIKNIFQNEGVCGFYLHICISFCAFTAPCGVRKGRVSIEAKGQRSWCLLGCRDLLFKGICSILYKSHWDRSFSMCGCLWKCRPACLPSCSAHGRTRIPLSPPYLSAISLLSSAPFEETTMRLLKEILRKQRHLSGADNFDTLCCTAWADSPLWNTNIVMKS